MDNARAWPRCRSLLQSRGYSAESPSALFAVPQDTLDEAWSAIWENQTANGVVAAYRLALAEAATMPDAETPTAWLESRVFAVTCLPVVLATAVMRSRLASGEYADGDSLLRIPSERLFHDVSLDSDLEPTGAWWILLTVLGKLAGEREAPEPTEDEPSLAELRHFPSGDSPQVTRAAAEIARFQGPIDFSDPWLCQEVAEYWHDAVNDALHFLSQGTEPYDLIDAGVANADWHIYYLLYRQLDALGLSQAADPFRAVAELKFLEQPPPRWGIGMDTARLLIEDRLASEALAVPNHLDPASYDDSDILAKLPSLPGQYEHAWGTVEEWNTTVDTWDLAYARAREARKFEHSVRVAEAHRQRGDIDAALANIPRASSTEDKYLLVEWARLLGYLEGRSEASTGFTMPPEAPIGLKGYVAEQFKRTNAMVSTNLLATVQVGRQLEAQGDLLLDMPAATANLMRRDFIADRLFEKHLDSMRRGWSETAKLEEHERIVAVVRGAIGTTAWDLLEPDSRDELRAFRTIKET